MTSAESELDELLARLRRLWTDHDQIKQEEFRRDIRASSLSSAEVARLRDTRPVGVSGSTADVVNEMASFLERVTSERRSTVAETSAPLSPGERLELEILKKYVTHHREASVATGTESLGNRCLLELDMRDVLRDLTEADGKELEYDAEVWLGRLAPPGIPPPGPLRRCSTGGLSSGAHRFHARAWSDPVNNRPSPAWKRIDELESRVGLAPARGRSDQAEDAGRSATKTRGGAEGREKAVELGGWTIDRSLGEGGQAHAFLAHRKGDETEVGVLKRLKNVKRIERFKREVDALRKLDHPGVVRLLDENLEGSPPFFLVMEYCEGGSLEDHRPSGPEALSLFEDLLLAVEAAHASGIVHRDLKPANILVRGDGSVAVGDWGICYAEDGARCTLTQEAVGPRLYMAPELEDGRADIVGTTTDLYSLGKVLYWLLSGGRMFAREKHRAAEWNLATLRGAALEPFNRILDRAITADPASRFRDIGEFLRAWRETRRIFEGRFAVVGHGAKNQCRFCGLGTYVELADDARVVRDFGITTAGPPWVFLQCDHCGHFEIFRLQDPKVQARWKAS